MFRNLLAVLLIGTGVSACASGKVETNQSAYAPAQFILTDVAVDVEAQPRPARGFIRLTRSASDNLRRAYNREMKNSVGSYTLEISLQDLRLTDSQDALAPITNNMLSLIATVRHPESGIAMRTFPVRYQLVRETDDETRQEQLLRGALPAAFNGLYGMVSAPPSVQSVVKSNQIFDGLDAKPVAAVVPPGPVSQPVPQPDAEPVAENSTTADVSTTTQESGEPKVIGCAIC